MNAHASINRIFRLIWNEALASWVPVSEITRGRGKRSGRAAVLSISLLAAAGLGVSPPLHAAGAAAAITLPPRQLPTGGTVVAGTAVIKSANTAATAVLDVDQTSQRAIVNWNTFNLGSAAQVNFVEPNSSAVTLNRVLDSNASEIFGKITSTGQIFISNPNGVYFGKSASVDVGGLTATTDSIGNAAFMAGAITLTRNGSSGSVVNDGQLQSAIGGYIALLAPEVRNSGVIVAHMGTVAMASGESVTLTFVGAHLAGISVKPAAIAALVENRGAVIAPGGVIILSAQAVDHLLGGVVKNSGTLEATGLSTAGGRIVLNASDSVTNSGTISADADSGGTVNGSGPAGSVTITAPAIQNSGRISAAGSAAISVPTIHVPTPANGAAVTLPAPTAGGHIALSASSIVQTATGTIDASGGNGGSVVLAATQDISAAGTLAADAVDTPGATRDASVGHGGSLTLTAAGNVTLQNALLDASGPASGGEILIQGGGQTPLDPPIDPPTLALLGGTLLNTSSRRGKGGSLTLTADRVGLFDTSSLDASGATGGGDVFVGGGFHGQNPSIADAQQTVIGRAASIDASATQSGDGGRIVLWSEAQTTFGGSIVARGGALAGSGGTLEVSSKGVLNFLGTVDAGAAHGKAGTLLLDPLDITVDASGNAAIADVSAFATNAGMDSVIAPATITGLMNTGTAVTLQANNDITINSSIVTQGAVTGGSLTFQAGRSITVNADVNTSSNNDPISFTANDAGASSSYRVAGTTATFINNDLIDSGTGAVSITMGTFGDLSGAIESGHIVAGNLTITHDGPTPGAVSGAIDLGETDLSGTLNISANSPRNVTNTVGNVIVAGIATINVGTGDVTIDGAGTRFAIIGLTAGDVLLTNNLGVEFAATNVSGTLSETVAGPIASTGAVQVTGAASFTANNGAFVSADPYINLTNSGNHFAGGLTLSVPSTGATQTGGYATIVDDGAISIPSSGTATYLNVVAVGAINATTISAGTSVNLQSTGATVTTGMTTASASGFSITAAGAVTTGTSSAGGSMSIASTSGAVNEGATTAGYQVTINGAGPVTTAATHAQYMTISTAGAVSLGATTLSADLNVGTSTGGITQSGALAIGRFTGLTAGATNDITLDNGANTFNYVRIVSGDNVTLDAAGQITFGFGYNYPYNDGGYTSHISGDFSVTAGGTISQVGNSYNDGYSAIEVDGATTFTANGSAPISLLLGTTSPFNGYSGQSNKFVGIVTLAVAPANLNTGFSTVELRNTSATASVLTGLTSVGTLANVYLYYDNAPSLSLPAMTVTGSLLVNAPSVLNTQGNAANIISQQGPISAGVVVLAAGATGDVVMTDPGNVIGQFGTVNARNASLVDTVAVQLYAGGYGQSISNNLLVTDLAGITDGGQNNITVSGTATFNAGSSNVSLTAQNYWNIVSVTANNVTINPERSLIFGNSTIAGTLSTTTYRNNSGNDNGETLTQVLGSTVNMTGNGITTFNTYGGGITLPTAGNVFGPLAIANAGAVTIRENAAVVQASAWTNTNTVNLTTSNEQAITLTYSGNDLGPLILTQDYIDAVSPGAVSVVNNGNGANGFLGLTQGAAWNLAGTITLNSGSYSTVLNNPANVLGPLQVTATTGTTNSVPSTVTVYAKNTSSTDAITDVGATGPWSTGGDVVALIGYGTTGIAGAGNITLTKQANALGQLYVKGNNVTITNAASILDGPDVSWDTAGDKGWVTTGTTNLVVVNPATAAVTLSDIDNKIGPISISTIGNGTLMSVLITDNEEIQQNGAWIVGTAPVTLDARTNLIYLPNVQNTMGNISINTSNGTTTGVTITEAAPITQGVSAWVLPGIPVTLSAVGYPITLTDSTNNMGNLAITGAAVSVTDIAAITQAAGAGGAWATTGITTLNPTAAAITLTNPLNVFGPLAIAGAPLSASISANANITQASAWVQATTPFVLNSGVHDIVLSQPSNQLGVLTLTGANATVVENDNYGILEAASWTIPGTTTLTAGASNPIYLTAAAGNTLGTVSIVSASTATIDAIGAVNFGASTIATGGTLTASATGPITQTGIITAPSLLLSGAGGSATLNMANNVQNLAADFSGGDLVFTNSGTFAVDTVNTRAGVDIGDNNVTLTSTNGTITGLSTVNSESASLSVTTGTALSLPSVIIAGAQTYTAGGAGITITAGVQSTATGAINFNSPVTLAASPLTIQSSNSPITFASTLAGGTNQLTVAAGSGLVEFTGAVSALGLTSEGSAALTLNSGGATFSSTLGANNGLAITGPVVFTHTVTLADGGAASVFTGLVTLGNSGGMTLSGYGGMSFDGGMLLQNGPATINSNNSPLNFQTAGIVSGAYGLTLNSGTAALAGLNRMDSSLTSLTVTGLGLTIPTITINGPQSYTATSGGSITLGGNVTSTAALGTITFNSPVVLSGTSTVTTSNSNVGFSGNVNGNSNLTVNAGSGTTTFTGAVGPATLLGSGTGAAITLAGSGATTFNGSVAAQSGITAAGPVTFDANVTLTSGSVGSVGSTFTGLVTTGGGAGNAISGFGGLAFTGGLALVGGAVSVTSNGSALSFGGPVSGAESLTLNALANGAGTVAGLANIGFTSNLTGLTVTAQTLSLPSTGLAVAGAMAFTAAGGITLNGAVGNNSGPATGMITFNSPVILASQTATVTTNNANVNFVGTVNGAVNGAQALIVNAGTGTSTFSAAVGATTALASLSMDPADPTLIIGGSIITSGAQTYGDAVTLGANTTMTGHNVQFGGTVDGPYSLTINDAGVTAFSGVVGGLAHLTSLTTAAGGTVDLDTTAVTTTGAQTFNDNMVLGSDVTFSGVGLTFGGSIDGAHAVTANASIGGVLHLNGALGAATQLTSLAASGNTIFAAAVSTTGTQSYVGSGGVTLAGNLSTTDGAVTVTGPTTLAGNVAIASTGGNITFSGATSSINGAYGLTLAAGGGNVTLGGQAGGNARLTAVAISGYDLTMADILTVGDINQSYTALDNITLTASRTLAAPISFTADSDNDGSGSFILNSGVSLTATNSALTIQAADITLASNSTLSSGTGLMTLIASDGRNIGLGGTTAAGQMTITGAELGVMNTTGGLDLETTGAGAITVNGISATQSQNIRALSLLAQGTGNVSFLTAASSFNAITVNASGGSTNVGVNLSANDAAITFDTPVSVSGASTINSAGGSSAGGNIAFLGTLAVAHNLTLTTTGGALSFGGLVTSNQTLTLNLVGGSVTGLGELQNTLTGLTVNSTTPITLPAFAINGPQVYNTGPITATGNLTGVGLAFNNVVYVVPTAGPGTALTLNAGTGTLGFGNLVSFNANNMTLTADQINFTDPVTGSGSLLMQPATSTRNVVVGGTSAAGTSLNLTTADLNWLPNNSLSSLTLGSASGSGTLDVAAAINPQTPALTLNGGGGISQSGGSVTSGTLTLYAAGNGITLANPANAFGAVGLNGTPSAVSLANSLNITQLGAAPWVLGSAPTTMNAGAHDITLTSTGNTFGTLVLTGGNVQVTEAADTDIGASSISKNLTVISTGAINVSGALGVTGNVTLTSAGEITQGPSAPLTIGGNLSMTTTIAAGNVTLDNSGVGTGGTAIGNTQVGGNYTLTAANSPITQAGGASLLVKGALDITGYSILLGGAGNLVGGAENLVATSTVPTIVVDQSGVVTLAPQTYTGNLTVISEATSRSFSSSLVGGNAIVLTDSANDIAGSISATASAPTVALGAAVPTGIIQSGAISVAGVASFTAQASTAGSSGILLNTAGNSFGTLVLSGNTVGVTNSATGATTIGGALATTSLTLATAGGVSQTGSIQTPTLAITSAGAVTLNNAANDVATLAVASGGNSISYVNSTDLVIAGTGINAGGANVSLTAGGSGGLTQTAALLNVGTLTASAGGAITLTSLTNSIASLGASTAGTGLQVYDSTGLAVSGAIATGTGDLSVRAFGNLTLGLGGSLDAVTGNVVASTEGAGNFINGSSAAGAALVVGSLDRWLVYSETPDLVGSTHTVKNGLTSAFRLYGATYSTDAPGSVTPHSGDGFIYSAATPTLTVTATVIGTPSQVYGSAPTATLGYTLAGFVDSEDNAGNVITGGSPAYVTSGGGVYTALGNAMNAGTYAVKYTGGLTADYTLTPAVTGATYTVTPAVLTYTATPASQLYGAAIPTTLGGTISGFQLNQTAGGVLTGTPTWTTLATAATPVGQYLITGAGYQNISGTNYSFQQAGSNSTALSITTAGLVVTATGEIKTYNGTLFSGGNGVTYSGFANGQSAADLGGTLVYVGTAQGARNAGNYLITPSGLTDGNYLISFASGNLTIGKAGLTLTTSNVTKTYNGTLAASGTAVATGGTQLFSGDTASGGTYAFTNANAGSGDKTVTLSGVTVNDGNNGGNYTVSYVSNAVSTINPAALTIDSSNVTKTYNDTLAATGSASVFSGALFHNASNGGAPDTLSGGTFAFTDASAGLADKTVTTSGVTVNDGNGGGNYLLTYVGNTTSTINPAPLTFVGAVADKTYDGTTLATLSNYRLTGFIGAQTVSASAGTANFASKDAVGLETVTIGGIALINGANGGLAANYAVLPTATASATIDPKALTVNAVVANKVYDGTTAATLSSYGLSGFVGTETVAGAYTGGAAFANDSVGTNKAVTITGITLTNGTNGGLATNYVVNPNGNSDANITAATLRVAGIVALNTVYDGTLTANVDTQAQVLTGVFGSDNVQVSSISGTYLTDGVGTAKPIVTSAFVLTGTNAGDYVLVQPTGLSASVTPRSLTVSAAGVNKVYDGTTAATVALTDNPVAGDVLTVTSKNAFLDKNAGTGKYISVSNIAISGADAADYTVNGTAAAFANITPAALIVTASGANKVYDGTMAATVTLADQPLPGDSLTLSYASAAFLNKNVGTGKVINVGGIIASGADAADYAISAAATATASISPATLTVGTTGQNKVFDGTTAATVILTDNALPGDQVVLSHTPATFSNAVVGNGKTITVGGIHIAGGADQGDYVLMNTVSTTTGDITDATFILDAAYTAAQQVEGGWSLPPAVVAVLAPSAPTAPLSLLDLALPEGFGGMPGTPAVMGPQSYSAPTTIASNGLLTVSMDRDATTQNPGVVTVSVPEQIVASRQGFSFSLPAAMAEAAASGGVRVTRVNGEALPAWLHYAKANKSFFASPLPAGALPAEVLVRIGARRWTVLITQ